MKDILGQNDTSNQEQMLFYLTMSSQDVIYWDFLTNVQAMVNICKECRDAPQSQSLGAKSLGQSLFCLHIEKVCKASDKLATSAFEYPVKWQLGVKSILYTTSYNC